MRHIFLALALALPLVVQGSANAQQTGTAQQAEGTNISFGGLQGDPDLPVTVTSQELTVDETKGTAIFDGDVLVIQGEMRLSAQTVRVEYDEAAGKISKLWATGDVLLVNASDAAQSMRAQYDIASGIVTMMGDVVLTQGAATFSADRFTANIATGLGRLEGGVTSVFTPSDAQKAQP